ncbi:MAG: hypothetical protein O7D27_02380 [Alphaproteobacteria bacterium]|nr:hypothetical protein [Alphaproteobacteria bacterium]
MLKKITLAAFLALGATTLAGMSALPAAAEDSRRVGVLEHRGFSLATYQFGQVRRGTRISRHGAHRRFLRRVRSGAIACFKKPSWRRATRIERRGYRYHRTHGRRFGARIERRGYRYHRTHGRRLGYRAVRRLVRHGRRYAMRCFPRI